MTGDPAKNFHGVSIGPLVLEYWLLIEKETFFLNTTEFFTANSAHAVLITNIIVELAVMG